jgi:phosphatidylglycerophosphate synthase
VVGVWLRLVAPVASVLRRVPPLALTALGLALGWLAVWAAASGWPAVGALLVLSGAWCDALDGAVAVLARRVTAFGAVADRVADRLSEVAYAVAFWVVGAPAWACFSVCLVGFVHEYARGPGVPVITVAERPTRVLFAAFGLLGAAVLPSSPRWVVLCWLAAALAGLAHLLVPRAGRVEKAPPPF